LFTLTYKRYDRIRYDERSKPEGSSEILSYRSVCNLMWCELLFSWQREVNDNYTAGRCQSPHQRTWAWYELGDLMKTEMLRCEINRLDSVAQSALACLTAVDCDAMCWTELSKSSVVGHVNQDEWHWVTCVDHAARVRPPAGRARRSTNVLFMQSVSLSSAQLSTAFSRRLSLL